MLVRVQGVLALIEHKRRAGRYGALLAGALLAVALAGPAAADVKAGVDAWAQGDYDKAVREWQPLADAGDADAQFNLGQAYKLGKGVPMDLAAALEYYRKASVQGHARAEDNYGLLLFQQNQRQQAMPYLERSAERGEPRAQYLVATALFNGDLLSRDWVRAYALMSRATAAGLPQAQSALVHMERYVPEAQRLDGIALAEAMAQQALGAARPQAAVAASAPVPARTLAPPKALRPAPLPPSPPAVAKQAPRPAPAAQGKWRVQLGAFSTSDRAEAQWKLLSARVGSLSAFRHSIEKAGALARLQAGPLASRAEAEKLCAAVKIGGSDCIVKAM